MSDIEKVKNGTTSETNSAGGLLPPIEEVVGVLSVLTTETSAAEMETVLREFSEKAKDSDKIRKASIRTAAVRMLTNAKIPSPARMVDAALGFNKAAEESKEEGSSLVCPESEPWEDSVEGHKLIAALISFLNRFLVLPPYADLTIALWCIFTFTIANQEMAPILAILSATKRCGKSRMEEIIYGLVDRPIIASSISSAALFRTIDMYQPTLLIDEFDAGQNANEDLRCILNAGHRRKNAQVLRCGGDDREPRQFNCFGAKAIAGIGKLPGTIEDRSIIIKMKRKMRSEIVDRFLHKKVAPELEMLHRQMKRWSTDHIQHLENHYLDPPEQLNDRQADNWSPLFAIAMELGEPWPQKTIEASLALSNEDPAEKEGNDVLLLGDMKAMFQSQKMDRLASKEICGLLKNLEDRPWSDYHHGRPISPLDLSKIFSNFGIKRTTFKEGGKSHKGYLLADFQDAFGRYFPLENNESELADSAGMGNGLSHPPESGNPVTNECSSGVTSFSFGNPNGAVTDTKSTVTMHEQRIVTEVTDAGAQDSHNSVNQNPDDGSALSLGPVRIASRFRAYELCFQLRADGYNLDITKEPGGLRITISGNHSEILQQQIVENQAALVEILSGPGFSISTVAKNPDWLVVTHKNHLQTTLSWEIGCEESNDDWIPHLHRKEELFYLEKRIDGKAWRMQKMPPIPRMEREKNQLKLYDSKGVLIDTLPLTWTLPGQT